MNMSLQTNESRAIAEIIRWCRSNIGEQPEAGPGGNFFRGYNDGLRDARSEVARILRMCKCDK